MSEAARGKVRFGEASQLSFFVDGFLRHVAVVILTAFVPAMLHFCRSAAGILMFKQVDLEGLGVQITPLFYLNYL